MSSSGGRFRGEGFVLACSLLPFTSVQELSIQHACVSPLVPRCSIHSSPPPLHLNKNKLERIRTHGLRRKKRTTSLRLPSALLPSSDKSIHDLPSFHPSHLLRTPLYIRALVWCRTDSSFDFYDTSNSTLPSFARSSPRLAFRTTPRFPRLFFKSLKS